MQLDDKIISTLRGSVDMTKLPEYMEQAKNLIPMIKSIFPMIKDWEVNFKLKDNQKIIYSMIVEADELYLFAFVIQFDQDTKSTTIVRELFKCTLTDLIDMLPGFMKSKL